MGVTGQGAIIGSLTLELRDLAGRTWLLLSIDLRFWMRVPPNLSRLPNITIRSNSGPIRDRAGDRTIDDSARVLLTLDCGR